MSESMPNSSNPETHYFNAIPGSKSSSIFRGNKKAGAAADNGANLIPTNAEYAAFLFSQAFEYPLIDWLAPPALRQPDQIASARVNQSFHVYHEVNTKGNVDDFYVVYTEDGLIDPGSMIMDTDGERGFFLASYETKTFPTFDGSNPAVDGVNWVASSPRTVNQTLTVQSQVITTVSDTLSLEVSFDPKISTSETDSQQIWNSTMQSISNWGIKELTNAALNTVQWLYYQQIPVDMSNSSDLSWLGEFCASGVVARPSDLSVTSNQWSVSGTWRFSKNLAVDSKLPITFVTKLSPLFGIVQGSPAGGESGPNPSTCVWSNTIDLASIIKIVSS